MHAVLFISHNICIYYLDSIYETDMLAL